MSPRWIGRFSELTGSADDPSMASLIDSASAAEAEAVARYLRSGHGLIDVTETRPDVLDGSPIHDSATVLGDGEWIWREDLAHYVTKYRLGLGTDFLRSVIGEVRSSDESALRDAMSEAFEVWQHD